MTIEERRLWSHLRRSRWKWRRQVPIGPYVADFACMPKRLIVEVDGMQHATSNDSIRTAFLRSRGFEVIRFWNHEVQFELEAVLDGIAGALERRPDLHRTRRPRDA
jgi:very-short-patch-repair endonuclease